jgi:hypothetical protein
MSCCLCIGSPHGLSSWRSSNPTDTTHSLAHAHVLLLVHWFPSRPVILAQEQSNRHHTNTRACPVAHVLVLLTCWLLFIYTTMNDGAVCRHCRFDCAGADDAARTAGCCGTSRVQAFNPPVLHRAHCARVALWADCARVVGGGATRHGTRSRGRATLGVANDCVFLASFLTTKIVNMLIVNHCLIQVAVQGNRALRAHAGRSELPCLFVCSWGSHRQA